jgi:hypothetical protein
VRRTPRIVTVVADEAAEVIVELARAVVLFCFSVGEQERVVAAAAAVAERLVGLVATVRLAAEERPLVDRRPCKPQIAATLDVVVLGEDDRGRRHVGRKGRKGKKMWTI